MCVPCRTRLYLYDYDDGWSAALQDGTSTLLEDILSELEIWLNVIMILRPSSFQMLYSFFFAYYVGHFGVHIVDIGLVYCWTAVTARCSNHLVVVLSVIVNLECWSSKERTMGLKL